MPELRFRLDTRFDDDDKLREMLSEPKVASDLSRDGTAAETGRTTDG